MSDITTPDDAKNSFIELHAKLVDAVREDPEVLVQLSRAQLTLVQDKLTRQYLNASDPTIAQGTAVAEALRKTANLDPKQAAGGSGGGFSINIVIPGSDKSVTVEGTAEKIVDE